MQAEIIRLMIEFAVIYVLVSWVMAFVVLLSNRAATPGVSLTQIAKDALVTALLHPLRLAEAVYFLALRVIAAYRK